MDRTTNQVDWLYRTLMIIWAACLVSHFLFLILLYEVRPEVYQFGQAEPFLGDHYIIVIVAVIFGLEALMFSFFRHSKTLKRSVSEQDPELVKAALIIALSYCLSVSLWGAFLAFEFYYSYFYLWIFTGILATFYYFPRRTDLQAARYKIRGTNHN